MWPRGPPCAGGRDAGHAGAAEDVRLEHLQLVRLVRVLDGRAPESEAGVVDQDVQPAKPGRLGNELLTTFAVGDVQWAEVMAVSGKPRGQLLEPFDPARTEGELGARLRERNGVAAPMPLEAPVTTAVLPSSSGTCAGAYLRVRSTR